MFVTRWSLGGENDTEGDPTIFPVAAISQYINKVSFVVLDSNFWLNTFVSVTVPIEHFNETYIVINEDTPIDCVWHPIHNSTNGVIAYGCNSRMSEDMKHKKTDGLFSAISYGFKPCVGFICTGYAYLAGMKLDSTSN